MPSPQTTVATLIPSQRHLFEIPDDIAYFNCAYMSPLPRASVAAGECGLARKTRPWTITPDDFFNASEVVRARFAGLINAARRRESGWEFRHVALATSGRCPLSPETCREADIPDRPLRAICGSGTAKQLSGATRQDAAAAGRTVGRFVHLAVSKEQVENPAPQRLTWATDESTPKWSRDWPHQRTK